MVHTTKAMVVTVFFLVVWTFIDLCFGLVGIDDALNRAYPDYEMTNERFVFLMTFQTLVASKFTLDVFDKANQ